MKVDRNKRKNLKTQAYQKLHQYFGDLRRNVYFLAEIEKIKKHLSKMQDKKKSVARHDLLETLNEKYETVKKLIEEIKKKAALEVDEVYDGIADRYGLDSDMVEAIILSPDLTDSGSVEAMEEVFNFCNLIDNYEDCFTPVRPPIPFQLDRYKQTHVRAYPVSLDIHKFATREDIIDYVEQRWDYIESYLKLYRGRKVRIKKRKKYLREVVDTVWANKELSQEEIVNVVKKKHPGQRLYYTDISTILRDEKKRRYEEIALGH